MIDEKEIWACATLLLKQHSENAWFVASQRADALLAKGQVEGHFTFLRILNRIRQLEAMTPEGSIH